MPKALIQPAGGQAARRHFAKTIERPVALEQLRPFLSVEDVAVLERAHPAQQVPTWGITGRGNVNVSTWRQIEPGDGRCLLAAGRCSPRG